MTGPGRAVAAALLLGTLCAVSTAAAQAKRVVRIWHTETEPQTIATINQIAADFERTRPDVTVKPEALPPGDLEKKLTAALATGNPPDAAHGQPLTCATFAARGLLRPLDDLVDAVGKDNVVEGIRSLCRHEGRYYGLGHAAATSVFVYRKDLLARKGLAPPRTWDELIETAEALKEVKDRQVTRWGLSLPGQPAFLNLQVGELLRANGGSLFDAEGRPALTEKPVIELLELYKKLNAVLPPGWTGHGYADTLAHLANGKAAMLYHAYGRATGYLEKYAPAELADPERLAVADKVVGPSGSRSVAQLDAEPWMVFKEAKHAGEAVEFLKFFYRDENYVRYLHTVPIHLLPVLKSTQRSPRYLDHPSIKKWRPWVDLQEAYLKAGRARPGLVNEWDDLRKPRLLEVMGSGILADMVLDTVKGTAPADAAAKAQKKAEELLLK
jgi:multiple sugar transport system substrate-binding protein